MILAAQQTYSRGCVYGCYASARQFSSHHCCFHFPTDCYTFDGKASHVFFQSFYYFYSLDL